MNLTSIPAPGAVLTFTGPASGLLDSTDDRPLLVQVPGKKTTSGRDFTQSALVCTVNHKWAHDASPQDLVTVKFTDTSIPDLLLGIDEEITYHVVDLTRPDLDIRSTAEFFGR